MKNSLTFFCLSLQLLLVQYNLHGQTSDFKNIITDVDSSFNSAGNSFIPRDSLLIQKTALDTIDTIANKFLTIRDSLNENVNTSVSNSLEKINTFTDSLISSPLGQQIQKSGLDKIEAPEVLSEQIESTPVNNFEFPEDKFLKDKIPKEFEDAESILKEVKLEDKQKLLLKENEVVDQHLEDINLSNPLSNKDSVSLESFAEKVEKEAEEKVLQIAPDLKNEPDYFDPSKAKGLQNKSKYFQSKETVNQEINARFKALGLDNIETFQDKLKASQDKLAKYQKKYSELSGITDLDKKPKNPMKDKSLRERLIWGGNFQVHRKNPLGIDFSPQVSYKLTRLVSVGVGGTYRILVNAEKNGIDKKENIYGVRYFVDCEVFKGFAAHFEYEKMRMSTPTTSSLPLYGRDGKREWISSGLVGIKKSYSITKRIVGNAHLLYNLVPDKGVMAPERLIFRVGFDLIPKYKNKEVKE